MMHVVTGGSGSGKSAYAEQLVLKAGETDRIYVATMMPYDEEGRQRVLRHRQMRKEKRFETIECYTSLEQVELPGPNCTVLLECLSNLVANELYDPSGAGKDTVSAVMRGIRNLKAQAKHLIVVTNEVFSDGIEYDESSMQYLQYLGEVNQKVSQEADTVTEVVYGIPVKLKESSSV